MGISKWIKAKMAIGSKLNSCLYLPQTVDYSPPHHPSSSPTATVSPPWLVQMPTTPTPSSSGLHLPKHSSKSCKNICSICLTTMRTGLGYAIFTAECEHSFHFHCITSNVKHGKEICPICRANWKEVPFQIKEVPFQIPSEDQERTRTNNINHNINRNVTSPFHVTEPDDTYNDDDEMSSQQVNTSNESNDHSTEGVIEVRTYPEVSAVLSSKSQENFSILVHLKGPSNTRGLASIDLVAVLDVSGSMLGTKLALLKRAMGFVIQNLGPSNRLSVIAFSSTAFCLFPLRRMSDIGRQEALQAINSLRSNGGTNIAEGLRKGAKVISNRKWKNPVCSIILLSDGKDTYTSNLSNGFDYQSLVQIPIHAFGFGADHDAIKMHSISENSGGTFSFIEEEKVIQDAFAQCIGGLLSVVVREVDVQIECIDPRIKLQSIKSGSYKSILGNDKRQGRIEVGDLYAEEERDFLITTNVPAVTIEEKTLSLINVKCIYRNPISEIMNYSESEVKIQRPGVLTSDVVCMEADKQRNRVRSAEAMEEARSAAEKGDFASALSILESSRMKLLETISMQAGDRLCVALEAELREMQKRMANKRVYETCGRAYVLSGLSSHSWQRATTRGDSTDSRSLVQAYQTQSMVDMLSLSQTVAFGSPSPRPSIWPTRSLNAR